jgi:hypothetical protein
MGIIYNPFLPDSGVTPLIIPYSNRANILSYLTYSNFVGGSTAWGSEWPMPMERASGSGYGVADWSRITEDEAIRLASSTANPQYIYRIGDSSQSTLNGCTVYLVCKYTTNDKNPRLYTYNATVVNPAYVFTAGREPGSNFSAWSRGSNYLQLDARMHNHYNVYAVNYYYDSTSQTFDVFAMFNLFTLKWNQQSGSMSLPKKHWVKREEGNMDIKFLSIVEGKESDDAIMKNVYNIMKYFNINDGRYW